MTRTLSFALLFLVAVVGGCAQPATVSITSPVEGAVVPAAAVVTIHVDGDPDTLESVVVNAGETRLAELDRDALFAGSDVDVPWDTTTAPGGPVTLSATSFDTYGNVTSTASVDVTVHRGPSLPTGNEGEGDASEGEGDIAGEGEGEDVAGEGEGEDIAGEGEGEGDVVTDPNWTPPPAHPFALFDAFPANPSGSESAPNPGNLAMYLHVPANMPEHAPVVVALHGCSQDASAFKTTSGWTALADRYKFYVIFPQQAVTPDHDASSTGNPMRCFNWAGYYGARMGRGEGENESIKEMVDVLTGDATYAADPHRVFATGLSAGGAMVPLLLATWPDVFAAGAPMAGVPYACATTVNGAISCMHGDASTKKTASQWGSLVRAAGPAGFTGPYPRLQVWHGDADNTVSYANMAELVKQWTDVHGITATAPSTSTLSGQAHAVYGDGGDGNGLVETVTIHGMDHGIAVDPGTGDTQGGQAGAYAYDKGIWSSYWAALFFGIVDDSPVNPGEGEGEGDVGGDCTEYTSTLVVHEFAFPPRVQNTGTVLAPTYAVVGSGEVIDPSTNPYLDMVTLRSAGDGYALGPCP